MSRFPLTIGSTTLTAIRRHSLTMPFHRVTIHPQHFINTMTLDTFCNQIHHILRPHRGFITDLTLHSPTAAIASRLLANIPTLERLTVDGIERRSSTDEISVTLPNLRHLDVRNVGSYLKCIRGHRVESLRVVDIQDDSSRVSRALNTFLRNGTHLTTLNLSGAAPKFELEKFRFGLVKFEYESLMMSELTGTGDDMPAMSLVRSQRATIRELTMTAMVTGGMLAMAFNDLQLQRLTVDMEKIFARIAGLKTAPTLERLDQDPAQ
jgi:hypothetical protein